MLEKKEKHFLKILFPSKVKIEKWEGVEEKERIESSLCLQGHSFFLNKHLNSGGKIFCVFLNLEIPPIIFSNLLITTPIQYQFCGNQPERAGEQYKELLFFNLIKQKQQASFKRLLPGAINFSVIKKSTNPLINALDITPTSIFATPFYIFGQTDIDDHY